MNRRARPAWLAIVLALMLGCRAEAPPAGGEPDVPPPSPSGETSRLPPSGGMRASELSPATTDAGLIDIPNARTPTEGILVGGQPSVEQFQEAAFAGYRTVVNLRALGEQGSWDEAAKAAELGVRYVAIPIAGADDLTAENARKLAEIVDDPEALPAMVHCASGNRVGALFALKALHVDGKSAESALTFGRRAGLTALEDAVRERLTPAPGG